MPVPNNSTVRWFHSEMAGAPQIDDTPESLLAIFDACLIDGFGTLAPDGNKIAVTGGVATVEFSGGHDFEEFAVIEIAGATPAALNDVWRITGSTGTTFTFDCPSIPDGNATGSITVKRATPGYWEKTFEETTRRAFRSTHPDATGCFLYLAAPASPSSNYNRLDIRGYEDMTDLDTGLGPFPDPADKPIYSWNFRYRPSPTSRHWALFADEKTIYVFTKFYDRDYTGGTLRFFGDFKPILNEAYNCAISGSATDSEYEPARLSLEHLTGASVLAAPRDATGANPGTNWLGRTDAFDSRYIYGELAHPAINGGFIFGGPFTLVVAAGSYQKMPRGTEPALYSTTSDGSAFFGQPNVKLEEAFKVLGRAEAIGRAVAIVRTASGDNDYESGAIGIDIEGPWA